MNPKNKKVKKTTERTPKSNYSKLVIGEKLQSIHSEDKRHVI